MTEGYRARSLLSFSREVAQNVFRVNAGKLGPSGTLYTIGACSLCLELSRSCACLPYSKDISYAIAKSRPKSSMSYASCLEEICRANPLVLHDSYILRHPSASFTSFVHQAPFHRSSTALPPLFHAQTIAFPFGPPISLVSSFTSTTTPVPTAISFIESNIPGISSLSSKFVTTISIALSSGKSDSL